MCGTISREKIRTEGTGRVLLLGFLFIPGTCRTHSLSTFRSCEIDYSFQFPPLPSKHAGWLINMSVTCISPSPPNSKTQAVRSSTGLRITANSGLLSLCQLAAVSSFRFCDFPLVVACFQVSTRTKWLLLS